MVHILPIKIECRNNIFYDVSDNNFTISTNPLVGLSEERGLLTDITTMPNPFKDFFTIMPPGNSAQYEVSVFNALGQKISSGRYAAHPGIDIELPPGPPGLYIIRVESSECLRQIRAIRE